MTKHEQPEAAVVESYEDAFAKLKRMQKLLADMESGTLSADLLEELPELAAKATENEKLKYRVGILKRAIDEQRAKAGSTAGVAGTSDSKKTKKDELASSNANRPPKPATKKAPPKETVKYVVVKDYGDSILEKLNQYFAQAVQDLFPEVKGDFPVKEASNPKFGDYQFDGSTQIARQLTALGQKSSPDQVAVKIIERLSTARIDLIEKLEPAKVFVNVFLNKKYIGSHLSHVFLDGVSPPLVESRRVVIDFSSPNIAKEMHVGHLRSTIIGESFSRLFEYVKFDVLRLNHIGDWGTQFGMLIAHLQDRFPNYLSETPPIGDLVEFYKESKKRFDEDEPFKKRAYECVVKLQNYDADIVKAWQDICDVSRKVNQQIYDHLGVRLVERGESFYQSRMQDLVRELEQQSVLKEEEGRKLLFVDGHDIPLTVVKSDGGYTYDTSDLAALKQRLVEERGEWLIYVVDLGQALHLEGIYAAGRQLGWYDAKKKRVEHVGFGLVLGEDKKKFKTRSGETVRLLDLLEEGVRRAEQKLREKGRHEVMSEEELTAARDAVAYGCVRYADLSQTRTNDYIFSFDRMLDDRGNTAVYLLYAYARIRSIARTAGISREQIAEYVRTLPDGVLPLSHEREFKLAKQILKFSDCLLNVLEALQLHKLCDYVYALATTFHDFYKDCYVINKNADGTTTIHYHRLVLCETTADVMDACFHILGITPVPRM